MTSVVYFVASLGLIKIGTTSDLVRRLETLKSQSAAPVSLLAAVDGDVRHERAIHDHLDGYRRHGEWFADCPVVRNLIRVVAGHGYEAAGIAVGPAEQDLPQTVNEARKLAGLIMSASGLSALEATEPFGLPERSIWSLRYRVPKAVSADLYAKLVAAARLAVETASARLAEDAAWIEDISNLRVERAGRLEEIEAGIAGLRARLHDAREVAR